MRVFRNFTTVLSLIALLALAAMSSGCEYAKKVIAKDKLNQGAILYNQGRTKEAQVFFKEAIESYDQFPNGWLFYGATLVKDYRSLSGDDRTRVADEALKAYKKALSLASSNCKLRENAISYIATIYEDLDKTEDWRTWRLQLADGDCATKDMKATTYYTVGVKYWDCSYQETTRYADKAIQDPFHYRNMDYPAALPDKQKAEACVTKGLEYVEKALQEDPEYVDALFYKGLLYRERQKMTKDQAEWKKLNDMAEKISKEASELQKKKEAAAAEKAKQEEAQPKG